MGDNAVSGNSPNAGIVEESNASTPNAGIIEETNGQLQSQETLRNSQAWGESGEMDHHRIQFAQHHPISDTTDEAKGGTDMGAGPDNSGRSPIRRSWKKLSCIGDTPGPRSGAASVVHGSKLYVFGGYGGESRLGDFHCYCFQTRVWRKLTTVGDCPDPRENNGFVSNGNSLYLFGGYDGVTWLCDLWEYNTKKNLWRRIEGRGSPPSHRFGFVSVTNRGKLILFGGYSGQTWLNDMYEFDYRTETWSLLTDVHGDIPSKRSCPSWAVRGDSIIMFGGYDGVKKKNDLFEYKIQEKIWVEIQSEGAIPSGRYFHSCSVHGDNFYVFGGYNGRERLNDLYQFSFRTLTWVQVKASGEVPSGRSSLVAEFYNNSLFAFGGYNGHTVLNDFFEYPFHCVHIEPPQLTNDLERLVNHKQFSDVTFLVEGKPIYAVRALLAIRSEHFRALLYSGLRESRVYSNHHQGENFNQLHGAIVLPDVQYDVFLAVLEFLYTDTVVIHPDISIPLLIASEKYLLPRLKSLCEESILKTVSFDNCVNILLQATTHNAESLKAICLDFIVDNLVQLRSNSQFQLLKQEPDLLMEIIMRSTSALNPFVKN